jgi:hypothetical protein
MSTEMDTAPSSFVQAIIHIPWKPIFQRLPGVWLLILIPFSIFGPALSPTSFGLYYVLLHILFLITNSRLAYGMYYAYHAVLEHSATNWVEKYCALTGASDGFDTSHDLPFEHIVHHIILPNYKETMETMVETLETLASHQRALTQYKVFSCLNVKKKAVY